jgi:DNA polymerase III subunit beta
MQLVISKKELARAVGRTYSIADKKATIPILSNILLSTEGANSLRFAATDLYLSVYTTAHVDIVSGGSVAVSARTFFEIARNLPDSDVTLIGEDPRALEIRSGKVRYKIPAMSGEDFPALPSPGTAVFYELDGEMLAKLIGLTNYAMSSDDTRPHLASMLFEGEAKVLRMVATDGHRLSKAECKLVDSRELMNFRMLIPAKGVIELKRLIEDNLAEKAKGEDKKVAIAVASSGGNAYFRGDNLMLSAKLNTEDFPPYAKVIPQTQDKRVIIDRLLLLDCLKRIALVAKEKSGVVRFHLEPGRLKIDSESHDIGEGAEEIEIDYDGEPIVIGFNARYMQEAIAPIVEDEIVLELGAELDPGVIRPSGPTDFVGVVMPMRI